MPGAPVSVHEVEHVAGRGAVDEIADGAAEHAGDARPGDPVLVGQARGIPRHAGQGGAGHQHGHRRLEREVGEQVPQGLQAVDGMLDRFGELVTHCLYFVGGGAWNGAQLDRFEQQGPGLGEEALRLYTQGSSWFSAESGKKGSLAPGQLADFIALTDDYFSVPDEQIKSLESVLTVVGGKIVGAIGVSGVTSAQDRVIAAAGVAALK